MAYQALYRTFRPETFSDIVGQEAITTTLKNQVREGRVAHAYLFCGSRGTGKTTTARVLARAINCLTPKDGCEPCGKCESCLSIAEERSMDVIEIDAASNNGVDEIRDLREKIKYPPSGSKFKVYIVDEVHMLSTGAFNALLKTLEEPPAHAVLILATTEPNKLPATILSRCQRFDFKRYSAEVIVGQLRTVVKSVGVDADEDALSEIARFAEGGMRDALSALDTCISYGGDRVTLRAVTEAVGLSGREFLFEFAKALLNGDAADALRLIDRLIRDGRDPQAFAREATGHMRALLVAKAVGSRADDLRELLDCTGEDAKRYAEQSLLAGEEKLMRMMDGFMRCESDMKWASQPRSALELCAFLCCRPEEKLRLDSLAERVDKLERALREGVAAPRASVSDPVAPPDIAPPETPPFDMDDMGDMGEEPPLEKTAAKPETKPETKPARKASAPSVEKNKQGQEKWDAFLRTLSETNRAVHTPLTKLEYGGIEGATAFIEYTKNSLMYKNILDNDAKKAVLSAGLTEAFSQPLSVVFRLKGAQAAKKADDAERTDTIRQARDIFGRENVDFME